MFYQEEQPRISSIGYLSISIAEPQLCKEPVLWSVLPRPDWEPCSLAQLDCQWHEVVLVVVVEERHSRGQLEFHSVDLACRYVLQNLEVYHVYSSLRELLFERGILFEKPMKVRILHWKLIWDLADSFDHNWIHPVESLSPKLCIFFPTG